MFAVLSAQHVQADDTATPPPDAGQFNRCLTQAKAKMIEGNWDDATDLLNQATELEPKRYEPHALQALVNLQQQQKFGWDTGQLVWGAFEEAEALAPPDAAAKLAELKATISIVLKRRAEGEKQLREFIKQAKNHPSEEQLRDYSRLVQHIYAADKASDGPTRRAVFGRFLQDCASYLNRYPMDTNMWYLRGMVALELDAHDDGVLAARYFAKLPTSADNALSKELDPDGRSSGYVLNEISTRWRNGYMTSEETRAFLERGDKLEPPKETTAWVNSRNVGFNRIWNVYYAVYETTVADYYLFVKETGRSWTWQPWQEPDHPAVDMTCEDAKAYCDWLTKRERKMGVIDETWTYRLPTDYEFSEAVGLGTKEIGETPGDRAQYSSLYLSDSIEWGDDSMLGNVADESLGSVMPKLRHIEKYNDHFPRTAPVGYCTHSNNGGIFDLSGNVSEWIADYYDAKHVYETYRGGNWRDSHSGRIWYRVKADKGLKNTAVGFRCVLEKH